MNQDKYYTGNIEEVMLKNQKDGEREPIQTEPVCEISCAFKNNPSIPFDLVYLTGIRVANYHTKFQFEVHTEKKDMKDQRHMICSKFLF